MPDPILKPVHQYQGTLLNQLALAWVPLSLLPLLLFAGAAFAYIRTWISAPIFWLIAIALLVFTLICMLLVLRQTRRVLADPLKSVTNAMEQLAAGRMGQRLTVKRNDELGRLAYTYNQMADQLTGMYYGLESKIEARTRQVRTAAEMAQIASSAHDQDELLNRSAGLLIERFIINAVRLYMVDAGGHPAPTPAVSVVKPGFTGSTIPEVTSLVRGCALDNRCRVEQIPEESPAAARPDLLAGTRAQAVVPVPIGNQVLAVLELQSHLVTTFAPETMGELQTLASQLAVAIQNFRLLQSTQVNLTAANLLYQASYKIAHARDAEEVFSQAARSLRQVNDSSVVLVSSEQGLRMESGSFDPHVTPPMLPVSPTELRSIFPNTNPIIISDIEKATGLTSRLVSLPRQYGSLTAAILPIQLNDELGSSQVIALFVLGARDLNAFNPSALQAFTNLAEFTSTTLEKLAAMKTMEKRLRVLQTLENVSQAISSETDLPSLYRIIHQQVLKAIGKVEFLIALYTPQNQTIEIPYAYEGGQPISIPQVPLGRGLTSIVIRSRQPLMLVEDVARKSADLGAPVTVGAEARSWLGVPLLVAGEPIGALVVQDVEREHRFTPDDQRLLTTMAATVAMMIRNVRLLDNARSQADRERQVNEISSHLSHSVNLDTILAITAQEVSTMLGARRATIKLGNADKDTGIVSTGNRQAESTYPKEELQ